MLESAEQLNAKKLQEQEGVEKKPDGLEMKAESGPETPEDLEKLAQEKTESAEKELEELSGSEERIGDCNNSINLPADKLEKIKATSGVAGKLEAIDERGKSLQEAFKEKMRVLLAGFMIAAGSMDVNIARASADSKIKSESKIEEVVKNEDTEKRKDKKGIIEDFQKAISELRKIQEVGWKIHPELDPRPKAEEAKKIIKEHIMTPQYLNKLVLEFNGDVKKAKNIQKQRLKNIDTVTTDFAPAGLIEKVAAFYEPSIHSVIVPDEKGKDSDESNSQELFHASTRGDLGISEKAKEILRNAYKPLGTDKDKYYSILTEILARKQKLDIEMEKLKIKKYGEKFTQEHYKKLMDFYKKGKLSKDAHEFIETIKPEYFEKIFNEIAKNEDEKNTPSSPV